ncbi:MAG: protein-disulfide reductase DsbD domain-containing protein, partial [Candidatus Latescibacterota bacterium]
MSRAASWGPRPGLRACWLVALLAAMAVPVQGAEPHPVQARLVAGTDAVRPGETFQVGLALRMAEGWHTYWRYSGDAGTPTRVRWTLPEGFTASDLQWPLPAKYAEAGDLTAYGYADSVLLLAEIRPPARLTGRSVRLTALVSWLTCKEVCIPGDTTLVLELPAGTGARQGMSPIAAALAQTASQIPSPLPAAAGLEYGVSRSPGEIAVELRLTGVAVEALDFYPYAAEEFSFASRPVPGAGPPRVRLLLRPYGEAPIDSLPGLVVYLLSGEEQTRAGEVTLVLAGKGPLGGQTGPGPTTGGEGVTEGPGPSLISYLLLALVGGVILNLMPCVLPVISLKVLGFLSQAGEEAGRVRRLGLVFSLGIIAAFIALALVVVAVKAGGEQVGWGFQFQYPAFVMGMAALVFALGLSLFGVFTVNLSGGGLTGLADRGGMVGSFFNGVLATILATPCTAPFLGTALGFAFSQPAGTVVAVFATVGLGMSLPYALLALRPGWVRRLPRPGAWMDHFKQLMGFLLMATVLWLLWVLGRQVGADGVVWTGAFLLCVALACWLIGQWVDLRSSRTRRRMAWVLALLVLLGGYRLFLAPVLGGEGASVVAGTTADDEWEPFTQARLDQLLAAGDRPVFIDFTAEWCWTCKVNERTVLASQEVRERFAA